MSIVINLYNSDRRIAVSIEGVAVAIAVLLMTLISFAEVGISIPLLRPLLTVVLLTFVPGALILTLFGFESQRDLRLFGFEPPHDLRWLVYTVGVSLLVVVAVGLIINYLYPLFNVAQPLRPVPLGITYTVLVISLSILSRLRNPPRRDIVLPARIEITSTPLLLLLLVTSTILAIAYLNRSGGNSPIVLLLIVIALVPLAVASGRVHPYWQPLALWAVSISLLYHKSLWRFHEFTGQGNVIEAWRSGRWALNSTSLLPNVTLSSTYAHLAGINIFTELNVINPLWVSFIPLMIFVAFRQFVRPRDAFLGVSMFAFIHPFYTQLPNGERAATPVFFLALLVVVLTDSDLSSPAKRLLGLGFTAGLVVSHYGAAYLVMLGVLTTVPLLITFKYADTMLVPYVRKIASNGGRAISQNYKSRSNKQSRLFSPVYAILYTAMTLGWYIYTDDAQKFIILPEHAVEAINDLTSQSTGGSGGTANRLARDYGASSIQLSKYIYVIITLLTIIGLAAAYYQRFVRTDSDMFDAKTDEFVAFSTALLGGFGLSLFMAGSWGGGRPMALIFCVTSIFAVIGANTLATTAAWAIKRANIDLSVVSYSEYIGRGGIAVLLAMLLILNTGTVAAVAIGGSAPSTVPLQHQITTSDDPEIRTQIYRESDVEMYVWLINHRNPSLDVYGDWVTINQYNDWYRPRITAGVDPTRPYSTLIRKNTITKALGFDGPTNYIMFGGHNTVLGVAAERDGSVTPINQNNRTLNNYSKIYTTGYSKIYFSGVTASDSYPGEDEVGSNTTSATTE